MKSCPKCGTQYTDDTLRFCLQDGTPLAGAVVPNRPSATIDEIETVVRREDRINVPVESDAIKYNVDSTVMHSEPKAKRPTNVLAVAGIIGVLLLLIIAVLTAAGLWLYSRNSRAALNTATDNGNHANTGSASNAPNLSAPGSSTNLSKTTPSPTPSASPSRVSPPPAPPASDVEQVKSEAVRTVHAFTSALEARDFNAYMSNYADSVDYYRKRSVGIGSIRADKARAFQLYDDMQVNISNETATSSPDGNKAIVTFDKEWHFSGRSTSDGKTRSQLDLTRVNGRWLITGERDLKVYYKR